MALLVDIPFSGPNGSTALVDNTGRSWTAQGNARLQDNALLLGAYGDNARTPGADLGSVYGGGLPSVVQVDIRTTNTYTGYQIIADFFISGSGLRWQLCLYNGGKLAVYNSSNGLYIQGTTSLNDGAWHTVRMERSGSTTRLYADGVLEATHIGSVTGEGSVPNLTIGTENSSTTQWLGSIRNLKIEVPDPALPLTHSPWIRRNYVGWDKVISVPGEIKSWEVYAPPPARVIVPRQFRVTRGVPPWWGSAGSTTQLPTYKIRGRVMVRDADTGEDTPLPNIRVALFFRRLHTLIDIQLSDNDGYVQFDNLMPGVQAYYGIAFAKDGTPLHNSVIWDRLSSEPGP